MSKLKDKVAIVTGASSGIGASIAETLSQHGVKVVLTGRNEARLYDVARQLQENSQSQIDTHIVDVTQKDEVAKLVKETENKFGHVDILVNSAGLMLSSAITDGDVEAWENMIDVNVKGTLYGINA